MISIYCWKSFKNRFFPLQTLNKTDRASAAGNEMCSEEIKNPCVAQLGVNLNIGSVSCNFWWKVFQKMFLFCFFIQWVAGDLIYPGVAPPPQDKQTAVWQTGSIRAELKTVAHFDDSKTPPRFKNNKGWVQQSGMRVTPPPPSFVQVYRTADRNPLQSCLHQYVQKLLENLLLLLIVPRRRGE